MRSSTHHVLIVIAANALLGCDPSALSNKDGGAVVIYDGMTASDAPSAFDARDAHTAEGVDLADTSGVPDEWMAPDALEPPPDQATADLTVCASTLANVGTNDFGVAFRFSTVAAVRSTLVFQRSACGGAGAADWWDVRLAAAGSLIVEFSNAQGGYTEVLPARLLNDGNPHSVVIARSMAVLSIMVDGNVVYSAPSLIALGNILASLGMTTGDPCEGSGDGTVPLVGVLTDVCLSR